MSVYIKGLEMPTKCDNCPFLKQTNYYASPYCRVSDDDGMMSINEIHAKRRDNCPLIPVPDHGRLIDADALIKKVAENMEAAKKADNYDWWNACSVAGDFVMDAPTIIPADKEDG